MSRTPTTGRPSLFRNKGRRYRVQGVLSDQGGTIFERARKLLAKQFDRPSVSDADVIEHSVRAFVLSTDPPTPPSKEPMTV